MRALVILALLASTAHADEVSKSPATALALSAGGTAASVAALIYASSRDTAPEANTVAVLGLGGLLVTPSLGHWYAGEKASTGLLIRAGGGAIVLAAALMALECRANNTCDDRPTGALLIGGATWILVGAIWDVATAPRAARRWNARHAVSIVPTVTPAGAGLAVGGAF
jgi:hypothetical protein